MRQHIAWPLALISLLSVASLAAGPPPTAVPTGMLPRTAKPIAYDLQLTILPEQERFSGHTAIDVVLSAPTNMLWINGKDLNVSRVEARVGESVYAGRYSQVDPNGVARIDFERALPAGRISLAVDYDAPFATGSHGLYHVKVGNNWYAWSNDEPTEARTIFPCFDEPGFKTPYTVSITTGPGITAVSNAPDGAVVHSDLLDVHHF